MTVFELRDKIEVGDYGLDLDREAPILPDDYIFNDRKSVAFNRELVRKHNELMNRKRDKLIEKQQELNKIFINDVCDMLEHTFGITHTQALACNDWVASKAYDNRQGAKYYFNNLLGTMEFLSVLFNVNIGHVEEFQLK